MTDQANLVRIARLQTERPGADQRLFRKICFAHDRGAQIRQQRGEDGQRLHEVDPQTMLGDDHDAFDLATMADQASYVLDTKHVMSGGSVWRF